MLIDFNADVGEGATADAELLTIVSSANVACAAHAGDPHTARRAMELAVASGVAVGAHPGYFDRENFGRREQTLTEPQIANLCFYQIGGLQQLARLARAEIKYIKPHGALYHQACRDAAFARPIVAVAFMHNYAVVGLPNSALAAAAERVMVPFFAEGFADRRYLPDGTLVPRTEPNAMIDDPAEAAAQVEWLIATQQIRTICVHGDTPHAVSIARAVRTLLEAKGHILKAFA